MFFGGGFFFVVVVLFFFAWLQPLLEPRYQTALHERLDKTAGMLHKIKLKGYYVLRGLSKDGMKGGGVLGDVIVNASLVPRLVRGREEKSLVHTAHAQFSQDFWEFGNSRKICSVTQTSARHADFSHIKDACH